MKKIIKNITINFLVLLFLCNTGSLYAQPEPDPISRELLLNVSWQFFYAGLMLLLAVFTWLIAALFRSRTFTFLGILMFFFVPYFLASYNLVYTSLGFDFLISRSTTLGFGLMGIFIFSYLFVSRFVNLSHNLPVLNYITLATTIIAIFFIILITFMKELGTIWVILSNAIFGIWILIGIFIPILTIKKGIREGRVLMVSVLPLSMGALLYIFQLIGLLPTNNWGVNGLQIGTIMFFWTLFYWLVKNIDKIRNERQQAHEMDRLKSIFFENISHEFRTPLTLVIDPIQKVAEKLEDGKNKKLLQVAHQNSQRLLDLINQILELTKLEASEMKLHLSEKDIVPLLCGITGAFESMADGRNISLGFSSEIDGLKIWVDVEKLQKIMNNLISNAFKFTGPGGNVHIRVWDNGNKLQVSVQDTGCGIPEEQLPHIFDRFFQADSINNKQGTGIGLALVKELVELHIGNISVESAIGKGATFTFQLPKKKAVYQQDDFVGDENFMRETIPPIWIHTNGDEEAEHAREKMTLSDLLGKQQQKLLVIEDNDDVRLYIIDSLEEHFSIIEAKDGQEGIDLTMKESPDLIICDVKMPVKNGYEVASALKSDMRSSHIPIIMLTAMVAKEDKIKGLELGVDDYLPKPFYTKELMTRVTNLIKQRMFLQEKFSTSDFFKIENAALGALDRKLLKDLEQILSTHYADSELGVEKLAKEIGMSQSNLNRKLNGFLGIPASKLIQNYRLRQAKKLLHQKQGNISEIAFLTGFGSPSYFVKCFREKYGKTPGNFLEEEK